jgi:hypothetical protein
VDITDAEDVDLSDADRAFLDYLAEGAVRLFFERRTRQQRGAP